MAFESMGASVTKVDEVSITYRDRTSLQFSSPGYRGNSQPSQFIRTSQFLLDDQLRGIALES